MLYCMLLFTVFNYCYYEICWLRCTVVERWSLASELSLSHVRLAADG